MRPDERSASNDRSQSSPDSWDVDPHAPEPGFNGFDRPRDVPPPHHTIPTDLEAFALRQQALPGTLPDSNSLNFELVPGPSNYNHMMGAMDPSMNAYDQYATAATTDPALLDANLSDILQAYGQSQNDLHPRPSSLPVPAFRSGSFDSSAATSEWQGPSGDPSDSDLHSPNDLSAEHGSRKKVARRQGVTCDQCRSKHLRCDLDDRRASVSDAALATAVVPRKTGPGNITQLVHAVKCSRCEEKGFICTKTHAPPSRRYPRPSRTGKRIEQARMMHGTLAAAEVASRTPAASRINASTILLNALVELRGAEVRITDRVMAGSLSLQLLNCFFAIAHMQTPVIEFDHFSYTFNASNGDPRKMSIMSNGGSEEEGLPAALPPVTGLGEPHWPGTKDSKVGTPGTTEALIAVMHAWAAHYTDVPIAFGSEAKELNSHGVRLQEMGEDVNGFAIEPATEQRPTQRRPKRKQGVACDTCRLRRVRCDLTERPEGLGCSRCEDKKIKCTDDYIQSKKSKSNSGNKGRGSPESSGNDAVADQGRAESGEAPSNTTDGSDKLSPRQWISSKRESIMRAYQPGDTAYNLRRGKARKAFCHALLNHALALVHKHGLLDKPSVEAAQALTLLAPLMDMVDADQAFTIADTACSHLIALGIVTRHAVNESDQQAVEGLLSGMQRSRLYLTTWCRDAIASGMNRRRPYFKDDRAIEVISDPHRRRESLSGGGANPTESAPAAREAPASRGGEVILSGEMGLTFVFMAQVQIGALSRFIAVHIDRIETSKPSIPPWQRPAGAVLPPASTSPRFPSRPSLVEVQRLEKACNAVWQSIDSLMLFFDRCAAKARQSMDKVKPFRPLGWIASTKISGSLLYLTVIRVLGERYKINASYMAAMAQAHGSASITHEDREVAKMLKSLFDRGMQKTLTSCRRTARLVEVLLPLGVFQMGGLLLKQIFPVAQFLARIPSIPDDAANAADLASRRASLQAGVVSLTDQSFIDPRNLSQPVPAQAQAQAMHGGTSSSHATTTTATSLPPDGGGAGGGERLSKMDDPFEAADPVSRTELGPFTHTAKLREVEACIEGLSQLGYAWDTMGREIDAIRGILESLKL
ncbi:uncharacterized protein PSFLO_04824 [Pseudozyma flocculosa]|nr:uncharacterized protein PSFLO_04824 [Pseudozyma flocculosa]